MTDETPACSTCQAKNFYTCIAQEGCEIERSQYTEAANRNTQNYHHNKALYRKRQEIY